MSDAAADDDGLAQESLDLANALGAHFEHHRTAAVYVAISMCLGYMAARAPRPDLDGLFETLKKGAADTFYKERIAIEAAARLGK